MGLAENTRAGEVTRLLRDANAGDRRAAGELLPLVYTELRALARRKMRSERSDHTLQATSLVHEAYLRLIGDDPAAQNFAGRAHFFAAAAEAMRRILVDRARRRQRQRHGGAHQRVDLDDAALTLDHPPQELLDLDDALAALAAENPQRAELVKLRFFAGLTIDQAAEALNISTATAERHWTYARAWLYRRMSAQ